MSPSISRHQLQITVALSLIFCGGTANALSDRLDLVGTHGFGGQVYVLPNQNIVVVNSTEEVVNGLAQPEAGAVYLYRPDGSLISKLTGRLAYDHIGSGGVLLLAGGNFVVLSPEWGTAALNDVGAVTWVNGNTGLTSMVDGSNSMVGQSDGAQVGKHGVALTNGRYLIASPNWRNGTLANAGALTVLSGNATAVGLVSSSNSIVGTQAEDRIGGGGVFALPNGDAVAVSPGWHSGRGAITQIRTASANLDAISASNSLVGIQPDDAVGSESKWAVLANGNYVVCSVNWTDSARGIAYVGAATHFNTSNPVTGTLSPSNSLVGAASQDRICASGVTALKNGHYVVQSHLVSTQTAAQVGAITWGHGLNGVVGEVSSANSLMGSRTGDGVGINVEALTDGNYVAASTAWNSSAFFAAGAITWRNGTGAFPDVVSTANSLVGQRNAQSVGSGGVVALPNGDYVVASPHWFNPVGTNVGAITRVTGGAAQMGEIGAGNSMIGPAQGAEIGTTILGLSNGHYVFASPYWQYDNIGSPWYGAITWMGAGQTTSGVLPQNISVIGATPGDRLGNGNPGLAALPDGSFLVYSPDVDHAGIVNASALCRYNGTAAISGGPTETYCLFGDTFNASTIPWTWAYDATASLIVVGRPSEGRVTIIGRADGMFANGFE